MRPNETHDEQLRRWWCVIGYEVSMLRELRNIPPTDPALSSWSLRNSITEGIVLHTRNLCDLCTSNDEDDIRPCDILDGYDLGPKYQRLRDLMQLLCQRYGKSKAEGDARWVFNKMLAYPTKERGTHFDYAPYLDRILPVINDIISEMETLRGCPFAPSPQRRSHTFATSMQTVSAVTTTAPEGYSSGLLPGKPPL